MTDMLKIARSYVAKGVSVIPVGRPDAKGSKKLPWISEWKTFQTRKPTDEELAGWFGKNKDWGIAIITGEISNLVVIDVDVSHGGTTKGLPPTLVARTQSGGWHFYYRYLKGVKNAVGVRQGVDIRSDGGYVVAPPSVGSKGVYEWAVVEEPQPFPADVFQIQTERTDWGKVTQGIEAGSRNQTAAQLIGKLVKTFKESEWDTAAWQMILSWNKSNKPPLSDSELRSVFNSITARERRGEYNEDDAPVVLLSEAAKKFATDITTRYKTGFSMIDDSTGGGFQDGDLELVVGQTGEGKTTFAQTLTYNLLENQVHSIWFSFEVILPELWKKFQAMGVEDDVKIYTPERYVSRRLDWLKKKIVEARDVYKCKVVFIDHLGFLVGEYRPEKDNQMRGYSSNLATVYGMICRDLKTIAVQEGIVICLLWHTRRVSDSAQEATLEDVKDSSSISQESDIVINVARERLKKGRKFSTETVEDVFGEHTFIKMLKNRRTGILKRFKCDFLSKKNLIVQNRDVEEEAEEQRKQKESEEEANRQFGAF